MDFHDSKTAWFYNNFSISPSEFDMCLSPIKPMNGVNQRKKAEKAGFLANDIRIPLQNSEPNEWNSMVLQQAHSAMNSALSQMNLNCVRTQLSCWQALINAKNGKKYGFWANHIRILLKNSKPIDWNYMISKQEGSAMNFASTQINLVRLCPQLSE